MCGQVLDGAAYHTHLDNVQRLRKGTLQVSLADWESSSQVVCVHLLAAVRLPGSCAVGAWAS